jgi:hypothetical protein
MIKLFQNLPKPKISSTGVIVKNGIKNIINKLIINNQISIRKNLLPKLKVD